MKKLKPLLIILSILLVSPSCYKPKDLAKAEIYKILNEIVADNNIRLYVVCASLYKLPANGEWSSEFTSIDLSFIKDQQELYKNFKLAPHQLKSFWPRYGEFRDVVIDTKCNKGILNKFSFPLISIDRKKVVLEVMDDCNCMLGSQDAKFLFVKINGHWKRTKSYDSWISENHHSQKPLTNLPKFLKLRNSLTTIVDAFSKNDTKSNCSPNQVPGN